MEKYVAVTLAADTSRVKKPRKLPSLHCKSGLRLTSLALMTSAGPGRMPCPNGDGDETAVPANSTPIAPLPVEELYVVVSFGTVQREEGQTSNDSARCTRASVLARSDTQFAWLSPDRMTVLSMLLL